MAKPTIPVRLAIDARDALSRLSFRLTGDTMRRVELSDALTIACMIAETHYAETLKTLRETTEGKSDD